MLSLYIILFFFFVYAYYGFQDTNATLASRYFELIRHSSVCHLAYMDILTQTRTCQETVRKIEDLKLTRKHQTGQNHELDKKKEENLTVKLKNAQWILEASYRSREE